MTKPPRHFWLYPLSGSFIFISLLTITFMWSSRGDWIYPEQLEHSTTIDYGNIIGQSFVARQAGLQGVGIRLHYLSQPVSQTLILKLYTDSKATTPLREAIATTENITEAQHIYFKFTPLPDSQHQYYYLTVQNTSSPPQVILFAAPLATYINGAAYIDGQPQDLQLSFHLNYHRPTMISHFLARLFFSLPTTFLILMYLIIPGSVLLLWLKPPLEFDPFEWLALAIGLSLACYPLIILIFHFTPIQLSARIIGLVFTGLTLLFLYQLQHAYKSAQIIALHFFAKPTSITFLAILALSLAVRLYVIDGLPAPLWADSYHHTMITQLIVDNGGLGYNWLPYAPMQSIDYHFGFHAMTAIFHWLTGISVIQSLLIFAQILNACAVLMIYLLGKQLGGQTWAGVWASLIVGLLAQYPMFYVNWGRFTQLAGEVLLPITLVLTWQLLNQPQSHKSLILFNAIAVASLAITHYRMVIFYPCFIIPLLAIRWYENHSHIRADITRLTLSSLGALLITAPRLIELIGGKLWSNTITLAQQGMTNNYVREVHNAMPNLFDYLPALVILFAWLGFAFGSWQRKTGIFALGSWWIALLLITNPHFLALPGSGVITNFAIYLAIYIPFSVLAAFMLSELMLPLNRWAWINWGLMLLTLTVAFWGVKQQATILDTKSMLVTTPDMRAMDWIKDNISLDDTILVNSRMAYGSTTIAGTDAGWWIPLLTQRQNTVPPMIYGSEKPISVEYNKKIRSIYKDLHEPNLTMAEFINRMKKHHLNYIYIGQQRGQVWAGDEISINPNLLAQSRLFKLRYAEDGVRVFQLQ